MKKSLFAVAIAATVLVMASCEQKVVEPVNPVEKFLGDYDMNCLCNDQNTPQNDSIPVSFVMGIEEIPGDTEHILLNNVHNLGTIDSVTIISSVSFNNDFNYSTGTLVHQDTVALTYMRSTMFCQGRGGRQ